MINIIGFNIYQLEGKKWVKSKEGVLEKKNSFYNTGCCGFIYCSRIYHDNQ